MDADRRAATLLALAVDTTVHAERLAAALFTLGASAAVLAERRAAAALLAVALLAAVLADLRSTALFAASALAAMLTDGARATFCTGLLARVVHAESLPLLGAEFAPLEAAVRKRQPFIFALYDYVASRLEDERTLYLCSGDFVRVGWWMMGCRVAECVAGWASGRASRRVHRRVHRSVLMSCTLELGAFLRLGFNGGSFSPPFPAAGPSPVLAVNAFSLPAGFPGALPVDSPGLSSADALREKGEGRSHWN